MIRSKKSGFTIIELLTIMSIIVILMSVMVPALNHIRRYSQDLVQRTQFKDLRQALEYYKSQRGEYPPSDATDTDGVLYCGAMKLAEAMRGQDGMGFHPDSRFVANGTDVNGDLLYFQEKVIGPGSDVNTVSRLRERQEYLSSQKAKITDLGDLTDNTGSFDANSAILCDTYERAVRGTLGMPVLYYKANARGMLHNRVDPDDDNNIYDYRDNHVLVECFVTAEDPHSLYQDETHTPGWVFYEKTTQKRNGPIWQPCNKDGYILISAGYDTIYGTQDDIFNFNAD